MKYTIPTYVYRGHRIIITPKVGGGCAAYCDGRLLAAADDHDMALSTAKASVNRTRFVVVQGGKMRGLGAPQDEWGEW
jgi:hypothetical protein